MTTPRQSEPVARFKAYLVDCDKRGEGINGFRRFNNLAKATLYAFEKNGTLYREYQDGSTKEV